MTSPFNDGWAFQVSPKVLRDHMVNIRANSGEEFLQRLQFVEHNAEAIVCAITALTEAASLPTPQPLQQAVAVVQQVMPGATESTLPAPQPQQPFVSAAAPSNAPACAHGSRIWKEGTSSSGKPWKAWMCIAPKGSSCDPQWVR